MGAIWEWYGFDDSDLGRVPMARKRDRGVNVSCCDDYQKCSCRGGQPADPAPRLDCLQRGSLLNLRRMRGYLRKQLVAPRAARGNYACRNTGTQGFHAGGMFPRSLEANERDAVSGAFVEPGAKSRLIGLSPSAAPALREPTRGRFLDPLIVTYLLEFAIHASTLSHRSNFFYGLRPCPKPLRRTRPGRVLRFHGSSDSRQCPL